ncbi:MAG: hypothetical protein QNJ16_10030 [Rhodobacter sp.]|nr:hypothetical protein [Rhodobacter sp.]
MRAIVIWFLIFLGLEAVLFAVSNMIDPQWAADNAILIFIVGVVLFLSGIALQNRRWLIQWVNGTQSNKVVEPWHSAEDAARHFRDQVGKIDSLYDVMRIFDEEFRKASDRGVSPSDAVIWAFRFWWPEGFEHQLLEARGVPITGQSFIPVEGQIAGDDHQWEWERQAGEGRPDLIETSDGQDVAQLEFTKASVDALVKWLCQQAGNWLKLSDAAPVFRDSLDQYPQLASFAASYDSWGKENGVDPSLSYARHFIYHVQQGIDEEFLRVRGRPENGRVIVEFPGPVSSDAAESYKNSRDLRLIGSNGRPYTDLRIERSSLDKYVEWLATNDNAKTGPENGQN